MDRDVIARVLVSRRPLALGPQPSPPLAPALAPPLSHEAEGGCGVIGIACSEGIAGKHLLRSLAQMRNRGNGKGGGIAAAGLDPQQFGVSRAVLDDDYLVAVAYIDERCRAEVERAVLREAYEIDHGRVAPHVKDWRSIAGLDARPPEVVQYFVRPRADALDAFRREHGLDAMPEDDLADEFVYQTTYKLNSTYYAAGVDTRAFVLSHGKDLLVLKMVGYGDDVIRYYQLQELTAHVWIGHHRYPTKGKVWHPGGAHPFVGLHEALVHNGDFANYSSVAEYLAQRNIRCLFLTDTEVSVLVFDLLHRTYGYPLEYVIEALAPTTERDFTLLPSAKQRVYELLQRTHIHGSPDGPWFFLIAQSLPKRGDAKGVQRLVGITDTSMLRPQVFALQQTGSAGPVIGLAASEKQAIDAALASLAADDQRSWSRADTYWNARGGSHTDGGAFLFTVQARDADGRRRLVCTDKFGREIRADAAKRPLRMTDAKAPSRPAFKVFGPESARELFEAMVQALPAWDEGKLASALAEIDASASESPAAARRAIDALALLLDRRAPTGPFRRSSLACVVEAALVRLLERLAQGGLHAFVAARRDALPAGPASPGATVVVDARDFEPEGPRSLAIALVQLHRAGFRSFIVTGTRGQRFIGCGLGLGSSGTRIDVVGSSGDYLASGLDGAEVHVHGNGQDQLAQIMKSGTLVVHGDVGQTFMYGAKGGSAFVLGNAAGRPLINAVGSPRVVINGTCLDYLAESFMAGDPLNGGGFVVLNGIRVDPDGRIEDLDTPYPGGNLFSLASGGAIYVRDPHRRVTADQLNGGEFEEMSTADWELIRPYLDENQQHFGIPVERLLKVGGRALEPRAVYRKIRPGKVKALQAEERWVQKAPAGQRNVQH